ncbi:MAG: serine/threonine-protein kinase [Planctomycetota bacterium]|nr:serine/threonine-protein kinase [Planctomycetota bacterium]
MMTDSPEPDRPDGNPEIPDSSGGAPDSKSPDRVDEQKTVISSRQPQAAPAFSRSHNNQDIGRSLEGRRLDYFILEEFVGGGGMGTVFRAIDTKLNRTVAVKVLSQNQNDEETLRRFKNEAQSAARLDHDNIARVYYVGEDDGWHFIVFEFIEGVNIRDLVHHKGPLGLDEALSYVVQIADALEHAHQRDVIHRDIKPSNVLVTSDGHAKLVDMGLARLHHVESDSADATASGVTLGTFDYISPEQARDPRNTDVRSDLYSLGCTLYFMLTGAPPFPEGTVLQKLLSHSSDTPPDPRLYRDDIDDSIARILNRLLEKQPNNRYQSPAELIGDLLVAAKRLGLPTAHHGTVWAAPSTGEHGLVRHIPWLVPALLLVLTAFLLERWSRSSPLVGVREPQFTAGEFIPGAPEDSIPVDVPGTDEEPPSQEGGGTTFPPEDGTPAAGEGSTTENLPGTEPPATVIDPADPLTPDSPSGEDPATLIPERTLVVGTLTAPVPENTATVATFAEALLELDKDLSITTIDIRSRDATPIRPFDLQLANRTIPRLTIRGDASAMAVIAFSPGEEDATSQTPSMIRVHGGELRLENLQLRMDLPSFQRQSWSLFELHDIDRISLSGCTATIHPPLPQEMELASADVAVFDWDPPAPATGVLPGEDGQGRIPEITLTGTIVRGPATLVRSREALPYRLSWTEGWISTPRPLVHVTATATRVLWKDGGVELVLDHVTAAVGQGICLLEGSERLPYPIEITARMHSCIFATEPGRPLFSLNGVSTFDSPPPLPKIHGAFNYYHDTDLVLSILHRDQPEDPELYTFDFINANRSESYIMQWYNELHFRPGSMLSWRSEETVNRVFPHQQRTVDLLLDQYQPDPADEVPGFHPTLIPTLPADPVAPDADKDPVEE